MTILNQKPDKTLSVVLLLITCFLMYLTNPTQANAQDKSIFSDNPKSNANDDTRLCERDNSPLKNDKYCVYYRGYKTNEESNPNLAAIYRNKMLYVIKEQIDEYYNDHKNGRTVKNRWFQTILDILGIGGALAANISRGERVKTVIAGSLGAFQAGRNSLNDRFELLQFQILINKMNANRIEQWTKIYQNTSLSIEEYPWDRARGDLQQYLFRGTFNDALDSLVDETGAEVARAKTTLAEISEEEGNRTRDFFNKVKELQANLAKTETNDKTTECLRKIVVELQKTPKFKAFLKGITNESKGEDILPKIKALSRSLSSEDADNTALIEKFENTIINTCKE